MLGRGKNSKKEVENNKHGDPRPRVVYSPPPTRGYFARELSRARVDYSIAGSVQTYVPDQSHFGTLRVTYGPTVFECF